jgi:hypothetical protein
MHYLVSTARRQMIRLLLLPRPMSLQTGGTIGAGEHKRNTFKFVEVNKARTQRYACAYLGGSVAEQHSTSCR